MNDAIQLHASATRVQRRHDQEITGADAERTDKKTAAR